MYKSRVEFELYYLDSILDFYLSFKCQIIREKYFHMHSLIVYFCFLN